MTGKEFINGVADGRLLEFDINNFCVEAEKNGTNIMTVLDELFAQSLSYHTHKIAFVEGANEIKDYGGVSVADQVKINRLLNAMWIIEKHFGINWEQPQQLQPQQCIYIPQELQKYKGLIDTPKARKYFDIAISKGVIEKTESGYRKCKGITTRLLAYFLQGVYDIKGAFPNKALCELFGERYLKQSAYQFGTKNHLGYGKPKGYELIDDILTKAEQELKDNE